jgi:hypothetical protein
VKYGLILYFLISIPCMGQTKISGEAKTSGPCSPAVVGSNITITFNNCRGYGNEKVEAPSFHEKAGLIYLFLGNSSFTEPIEALRKREFRPLEFNGHFPFTLKLQGDVVLVSFKVQSPTGDFQIEVDDNNFTIAMPNCDWNYTANALEVVNGRGVPIFQLIRKSQYAIIVNGIFPIPGGFIVAGGTTGGFANVQKIPKDYYLEPIFKYPAWEHPGKYADDSN